MGEEVWTRVALGRVVEEQLGMSPVVHWPCPIRHRAAL